LLCREASALARQRRSLPFEEGDKRGPLIGRTRDVLVFHLYGCGVLLKLGHRDPHQTT